MRFGIARIRSRARDLERNSPIAKQYLRMCSVNIIGPNGIKCRPQARLGDASLDRDTNELLAEGWADWSRSVTLDGKMSLNAFSRLAVRGVARDGEGLVRIWRGNEDNPYGIALEGIDPTLLDETLNVPRGTGQNEIRLGVEVDEFSKPVAYHIWNSPQRLTSIRERKLLRIPADQIRHIYDPEQVNQTRGLPWMLAAMMPIRMLEGYREAEVVAARLGSAKMGFFQRKDGMDTSAITADGKNALTMDANPGTFHVLPDGYEVSSWQADHPSTAYAAFIKDKLRECAQALGVSYNALASDLEGVNYSSMRSGLLIERDAWRVYQQWWIESFLDPIYREWASAAMLRGFATSGAQGLRLRSPEAAYAPVRWSPRGWPWVDPMKDVQATKEAIDYGLASRTQALAEQGLDYEETLEELRTENELADEYEVEVSTGSGGMPVTEDDSAFIDDESAPAPTNGKSSTNANHRRRF
jgi:lambda family phage portal protein